VLSTSKDAQRAAAVWESFNSKLGVAGWKGPLFPVGQIGCEMDASGVSPAYMAPSTLLSVAGFWFVQLFDTVFSTSSTTATAHACAAMNFSVVHGEKKFLSGVFSIVPLTFFVREPSSLVTFGVCSVQRLSK
jgi:hypothetical protein